jgi:hypothetical protein
MIGSKHSGRTIRNLGFQGDIWPILDQWAAANDYMLMGNDKNSRTYQLGIMPLSQRILKISLNGNGYVLEAWVKVRHMQRIGTLGPLMPSEFRIDGGGIWRKSNRKLAREEINPLLASLGELPIS